MKKLLLPTAPIFALALFFGCNGAPPVIESEPRPFDDGFIRLAELEDEDPNDDVVEVSLVAKVTPLELIDGVAHDQFTYNGSVPGPLIRAKKGDTLVVNLKNDLSEGTTIHWHGMRVPNGMDGVPGHTQEVVEPGEDFRYEFELLDASTFWYHPHYQTLEQVGNGLYGAVLVEDPEEEADLGKETVFAISDVSLHEDGSTQEHPETDELRAAGREGATLLLNGHPQQRMRVRSGERLRWRVLNMARSRYLELQLKGHDFLRIGSDGGRMESPVRETTTSLVPGERVDVIIEPTGEVGTHLDLVTLPVDRGPDAGTAVGPEILLRLEFAEGSPPKNGELPHWIERFRSSLSPMRKKCKSH
jgi:FtsP/CotA-like multicopper oxidase with cupredoxin domain